MITFEVKDMTCGHCVSMITKALKSVDSQAKFTIDQAKQLVMIDSTSADLKELQDAIADAGYSPVLVDHEISTASVQVKSCCSYQQ
ncbi:heavy-metal-associated domain-containing protein [Herbaspirillum huttiense]|uniref:Heavy-metal-associated domain-containing protein n=2 Tax=Herbaspirillum huttiense TaxID=863372 RepID=A0AAJ2H4U7_9BURK|nr:heavy-metal-associated domain-containing protein [Herbaspirillum huttiense]MDR9836752.1 heavy-metal-associated domain-containing protein [Herbaspirillum huttiense]